MVSFWYSKATDILMSLSTTNQPHVPMNHPNTGISDFGVILTVVAEI